jgi:hypothetical protein
MSKDTKQTKGQESTNGNQAVHLDDVVGSSSERSKIIYPIGGFAPGQYWNKCALCGETFIGDKRAWNCEPCAVNGMVKTFSEMRTKLTALETALKTMLKAQREIEDIIDSE